jgi:hypothetical protein
MVNSKLTLNKLTTSSDSGRLGYRNESVDPLIIVGYHGSLQYNLCFEVG